MFEERQWPPYWVRFILGVYISAILWLIGIARLDGFIGLDTLAAQDRLCLLVAAAAWTAVFTFYAMFVWKG